MFPSFVPMVMYILCVSVQIICLNSVKQSQSHRSKFAEKINSDWYKNIRSGVASFLFFPTG